MPDKLTVLGLLAAFVSSWRLARREPVAPGVNVTLMPQLPPAATVDPHALVCAKSAAFAPVNVRLLMTRAPFPVLFNVTD